MRIVIIDDEAEQHAKVIDLFRSARIGEPHDHIHSITECPAHSVGPLCREILRIDKEGRETVGNHQGVDVVVLDMQLGSVFGLEVAEALGHLPFTFVIHSSLYDAPNVRERAKAAGVRFGTFKNRTDLPALVRAANEVTGFRHWAEHAHNRLRNPLPPKGDSGRFREILYKEISFASRYTGAREDYDQVLARQISRESRILRGVLKSQLSHYKSSWDNHSGVDCDACYFGEACSHLVLSGDLAKSAEESLGRTDRLVTYR